MDKVHECKMCGRQKESMIDMQKHILQSHKPDERRDFLIEKSVPAEDTHV